MTDYDNIGWSHFTSFGFGIFFVFYFYMMIKYDRIKFEASKIKYLIILLILGIFFGVSVGISLDQVKEQTAKAATKIGLFVFAAVFAVAFVNARYNYKRGKRGMFHDVPIIADLESYIGQSFDGVFDYGENKDIDVLDDNEINGVVLPNYNYERSFAQRYSS